MEDGIDIKSSKKKNIATLKKTPNLFMSNRKIKNQTKKASINGRKILSRQRRKKLKEKLQSDWNFNLNKKTEIELDEEESVGYPDSSRESKWDLESKTTKKTKLMHTNLKK